MATSVRILHLEDNPTDSELVGLALREAGLSWDIVRVETRDSFVAALEKGGFDLIVSDYRLPTFDGLEALRETRTRRPELAFVFFTATLGEERAVEALKAGATDFVAKGNRDRLAPALQRAVAEAAERTARRRVEEALRQKEASFRLLFDSNPLPMWVFDRETLRFLEVHGAAVAHYGYTRDEFLAMRITDIRPPENVPLVESSVRSEGAVPIVRRSGTWRHRLKDGRVIDVEIVAHDLEFGGRQGRLVVAHDVTERKRLEGQLLQSQKLEAIGQLAGGVAHDFNNLLNVILGYSDLALRDLPREAPQAARLQQIRRAAERGATLTRQLLAFSRKQVREPKVLDLNRALADVQGMLGRLIGENIEIVTSLEAGLGHVEADPGQMEQVLLNLAVNARDAMPQGGKLILETTNVDLDEAYARTHTGSRPGPHVRLAVSDTGHGMDAPTLARLFEPFFTTKPRGKGTGLGLATVYGIVKQSEGHIDVYSEPGRHGNHPSGRGRRGAAGAHRGDPGGVRVRRAPGLGARARSAHRPITPRGDSSADDGRDHAPDERAGPGRAPARGPPGHEGPLHVRVHGRGHRPPRGHQPRHPFPPEAVRDEGPAAEGAHGARGRTASRGALSPNPTRAYRGSANTR